MPFCPKCKIEYREGFSICSDCKIPLVDSLENMGDSINVLGEEDYGAIDASLIDTEGETGSTSSADIDKDADLTPTEISKEEYEAVKGYIEKENENRSKPSKQYVSTDDKSKEYLSTGITLITIGVLSCTFIALFVLGVLPFKFRGGFSYVIYGVLFLFFASFIYFGINSICRFAEIKKYVQSEKNENSEFEKWFKENITREAIDAHLPLTGNEQSDFFMRNEKIKFMIFKQFPDLSSDYVDMYIDGAYGDIFE